VSSPARQSNYSGKSVATFSNHADLKCQLESPLARSAGRFTAFSFEFVAKPEEAANAVLELPAAIQLGLGDFVGFSGSLVMVSDLEARLITLIIFWRGSEARRSCEQSVRRVRALLAPYLDRCLRAQHLLAHMPTQQALSDGFSPIDTSLIASESIAPETSVCVA